MFLQLSVILLRGGLPQCMLGYTPQEHTNPWTRYTPPGSRHPLDQVHPLDQLHPPGPGTHPPDQVPPDQVHPQTRCTPPGPGTSPQTRYTLPKFFWLLFCIFLYFFALFSLFFSEFLINYFIICSLPNPPTPLPPEQCMLGDTGNKRAVCILLECILVLSNDYDNEVFESGAVKLM